MKKYIITCSVITLVLALILGGCGKKEPVSQGPENQTQQTEATQNQIQNTQPTNQFVAPEGYVSVVQVTINPTVNLYLDGEEKILAVEYVNEDAKDCYKKMESQLVGAKLEDGVKAVIEAAAEDGYLQENQKVTIDVVQTQEEDKKIDLLTGVQEAAKTFMTEQSIAAEVTFTDEVQKEIDDKIAADQAAAQKELEDKLAAEKEAKNPIKNLKTGVEYGLLKPGEDEVLLTGVFITFDANGGYQYGMAPYLNDEFGEGEYVIYNNKKYYLAGGGGGSGTYTMTEEKIIMAGAYDMELTMTAEGELVVAKADSTSDFFAVGDKLTKQ